MGLTDYTISDKKYWQAGRDYENKRIIQLLEGLAYKDEKGHEMISEFKDDLIRAIEGEQK